VAVTLNKTDFPRQADWAAGWAVMVGGTFTVSTAAAEVMLPAALVTTTV